MPIHRLPRLSSEERAGFLCRLIAIQAPMLTARSPETKTPPPSLELALLCAHIASSRDRGWLSRPVSHLIPEGGPSLERLSRLKARLLGEFETLLEEATRSGRPPREPESEDESHVLRELLALVPREVWTQLSRHRQQALVATQERLKDSYGLTQTQFCERLGISERTFRSWKEKKQELPPAEPDPEPEGGDKRKKPTPKATGRFDLATTMPGIQLVGDTTRWEFFGVPLYLVAVQDPGWRKQRLWESFAVHTAEDSELIVRTVEEAAQPGTQFLCDQGTPYMSEFTRQALALLECEHAPQKEGAPTEKATKERAFRTVKDALEPLSELSRRIAEGVPALRNPDFARAVGRVALACFLRVYEAAPRQGGHPLAGRGAEELDAIAQAQREKARAEFRSVRLALEAIHRDYRFPGSTQSFISAHRRYALEDILEAERRLRSKAGTTAIKAIDQYFAAILRNVRTENQPRREEERQQRRLVAERQRKLRQEHREEARGAALLRDRPELVLAEGLDMVNLHWIPHDGALIARGRGLGTVRLREALQSMTRDNPYTVRDRAQAVWTAWVAKSGGSQERLTAVRAVFDELLDAATASSPPLPTVSSLLS